MAQTADGVTSIPGTQGKAQGSGLWGYVGDVKTRSSGNVFTYGLDFSPTDHSLWVTDSAKINWVSSAICGFFPGGVAVTATACYVGDSRLHRYELDAAADWSIGQYQGNGVYGSVAAGANAGVGANYERLADAQVMTGEGLPSGQFGGVRGVAVTNSGVAWALDSDAGYAWLNHDNHALRMVNPDGTEAGALGQTVWPSGNSWANRHAAEAFDYPVGIARMANGNMIVTSQTPELLKEYREDGTFVRNIYLNQPAGTLYSNDAGYRSPYAVAVDPADGTLLVGYTDPGAGRQTFIQRIDPADCTTESVGNPTGSSRDRCTVLDTIGVGTLVMGGGNGTSSVTFSIQVEPVTGDIYVAQGTSLVQVFASDGTPKGTFSAFGYGSLNGQVAIVRGIAFDARGFMYLTVGEGTTNTRVVIFARTPDPVTNLVGSYVDETRTSATLTWTAIPGGVTADAQAPLLDYVIEQSESTDCGATWGAWTVASASPSSTSEVTLTGLDHQRTYRFRVSAWNEAGNGDWDVAQLLTPSTLSVVKTGDDVETDDVNDPHQVEAGSTVAFEYVVTNTSGACAAPVTGITLTDSVLGTVSAPAGFDGTLAASGESVTFTASGPVAAGPYQNTATAAGTSAGSSVPATDDWFGFGVARGLTIVKTGNGEIAPTAADAVQVGAGSTVTFNYTVTNTGNVPVTGITLTDSVLGAVSAPAGFDGTLAANGGSMTFTASGPVAAGPYQNTGTVTGTSAGQSVSASDDWFGFGADTGLTIVKTGNGVANADADSALQVPAGSTVAFEYLVTNTGNVPVTGVTLTDSVLGAVSAPAGFDGTLAANGGSVTFTASGPVAAGPYQNTGTVTGESAGQSLTESDDWFGFGVTRGLTIVKTGHGQVAPTAADAVEVPVGTVAFEYRITNTGNVPVTGLALTDDQLGVITAPADFDGTLAPGDSVVFTASGPVALGDYVNVAGATGTSGGEQVAAGTEWHGIGVASGTPDISIVKRGNGVANSSPAGALLVVAGSSVTFTYTITNTGTAPITGITLTDDRLGAIAAPAGFDGTLAPGESVTFTATGQIGRGAYKNIATVTGTSAGESVTASDDWFGFGTSRTPPGPGTPEPTTSPTPHPTTSPTPGPSGTATPGPSPSGTSTGSPAPSPTGGPGTPDPSGSASPTPSTSTTSSVSPGPGGPSAPGGPSGSHGAGGLGGPGGPGLPSTGSNGTGALTGGAVALLLLGGTAVYLAHRRRSMS